MASFVSHKYRLIFCHIPRTGGTSFFEAVKPYLGEGDDYSTIMEKHHPLSRMEGFPFFDRYEKVTIVRDEDERQASLRRGAPKDMPADAEYWWPWQKWICDPHGVLLADVMIPFSQLAERATKYLERKGIRVGEFPHLNRREKP